MWNYYVESESFTIEITGGSVRMTDKSTGKLIKVFSGYTYLYTGGVNPNECDFFALENGKHFYVYSLKNFKLLKRVTLPRTYEAIDVCGFYSDDGKVLNIPAERYVYDDKDAELGHFEYILCRYETDNYSMIEKVKIADKTPYLWQSIKEWTVKKSL